MGFSRQEYWNGLPFPSPVDHVLSELSTMTRLSWVALHGMAYGFIELDKAVVHVISLISFLWLWFSFFLPLRDKDKRLMEVSSWERLLGKLGLVLMGGALLSISLIQFSVDWQGSVPSLLFDLRPNYGGVNEIIVTSFKRSCAHTVALSAPSPAIGHCWLTPPPETPRHSQASLGQSLVGLLLLSPGSWCTQGFVCALQETVSSVLCKFHNQIISLRICVIPHMKK